MQILAATAELSIPHFATKSIFAAGAAGAASTDFSHYLKGLSGRRQGGRREERGGPC
jgi:hypothetical protein